MADIFVSYKREDRERIVPLARALEARGYTVWWDLELVPSQKFERQIKRELDAARCVIVVWTERSVGDDGMYVSEWVQIEANSGDQRGILLPVQFDPGRMHWRHGQSQFASLHSWMGDESAEGFVGLLKGVTLHAGARERPIDQELLAWQEAERAQTAEAFRHFLKMFPQSRFADVARGRTFELDELAAWKSIGVVSTIDEMTGFLHHYPNGRFADDARAKLQALAIVSSPEPIDTSMLATPLQSMPTADDASALADANGNSDALVKMHRPSEARLKLDTRRRLIWGLGAVATTIAAGGGWFIVQNRQGSVLNTEQRIRAAWSSARAAGTRTAMQAFLSAHPNAPQANEARDLLALTPYVAEQLHALTGHVDRVTSVAFSPDGSRIASVSWDNSAKLWDVGSGRQVWSRTLPIAVARKVSFSPSGEMLAIAAGGFYLSLLNSADGSDIRRLRQDDYDVNGCDFFPDGQTVLAVGVNAQIWNVGSGSLVAELYNSDRDFVTYMINTASVSPNGGLIATGDAGNRIRILNASSLSGRSLLRGHTDEVNSVQFSRDGQYIVSASNDRKSILWSVATGEAIRVFSGHSGRVHSASFSPDGDIVVTASADKTARLWQTTSGATLGSIAEHVDEVYDARFSPVDLTLATASSDNSIKLWRLQ